MDLFKLFQPPGGNFQDLIGSPITAAETISPDRLIHHISGSTEVATIVPPYEDFSGPLYFVADVAMIWNASGNIATPGSTGGGRIAMFIYDHETQKWYSPIVYRPFTIEAGVTGSVPVSVGAIDFVNNAGNYSGFEISFDGVSDWDASKLFTELGPTTIYVRGQAPYGSTLILPNTFTGV